MKVERAISDRPLEEKGILAALNNVVIPTLRQLLKNFNGMTFEQEFTSSDLDSGVLTVDHELGGSIHVVTVRDQSSKLRALPDETVTIVGTGTLTIDLSSFVVSGTWRLLVQRG